MNNNIKLILLIFEHNGKKSYVIVEVDNKEIVEETFNDLCLELEYKYKCSCSYDIGIKQGVILPVLIEIEKVDELISAMLMFAEAGEENSSISV